VTGTRLPVALLMRAPRPGGFSIEAVFGAILPQLPPDIDARLVVPPFPSRGILPRLRAMLHARRACRGAAVVHMTGDAHFLLLLLPRGRAVLTVHDCEFLDRSRGLRRFLLWLFWLRLPAWRAQAITVISEDARRQLLRWLRVDPARITVIENPQVRALTPHPRPFDSARPRLLMIGTAPHKNLERVAAAVAGLPVVLEVIGPLDPGRLAALRAPGLGPELAVETRQDLTDAGIAEAYGRADIVMFPSLAEGFGLPILEGQAAGRPVVTSDRAPMRDVAGAGALLVDPEDPAAIRDAVVRLCADPALRARLVAAGFANLERFDPRQAAARYAALWRRLAAEA
jgi:glycosyltransferase involved in cell wall biosynthesis